jgi:glycosyltransferase involved in cell wall biosynthesis
MYDVRPGGPQSLLRGGYLAQYGNEAGYDAARNKVARSFLDERDADWLWWVDSDMGWSFDSLERLMACAHPTDRPIVGGLCFGNKPVADDGTNGQMFQMFPTVYALDERDDKAGFSPIYDYPVNELIQVGGTGSAFVLIHRSVFQRIRDRFGDTWYDRIPHPKNDVPFGEDLSFCLRAIAVDAPIFVHTGVRTNHHKWEYLSEPSYFARLSAPPAKERVTVIVPVLHRPQNVAPLVESLRASTGLADVVFVCEDNDLIEWAEVDKAGAKRIVHSGSFAVKVNRAMRDVDTPWVFIVGDDVRFHPGWLDHAQFVGNRHNAAVVGTNDLLNPRVLAGEHATHLLIRTDYVKAVGASWDGPGVVCHEGYTHWYVDDEIVTAAKQREQWAMALGSHVEHLHHLNGKAAKDDVYEKGQANAQADAALFAQRARKFGGLR